MRRVTGVRCAAARAGTVPLLLALALAVNGALLSGCADRGGDGPVGRIRLLDSWLSQRDPGRPLVGGPLRGVSRRGLRLEPGATLRFPLTLPRRARFHAVLGMDSGEPHLAAVDLTECGAAAERSGQGGRLLSTTEVRPGEWSDWDVDLSRYGGQDVVLCFAARVESPDGVDPPPVWLTGAEVEPEAAEVWPPGRPNVVLITLDTTRGDHLSSAGYPRPTSPNLDRLASEGELYLNAVTNSAWTLPSHASLFTGLHSWDHGARSSPEGEHRWLSSFYGLDNRFATLAEQIWTLGYDTGGVVAGPMVGAEFGFAQGFDYYDQVALDGHKWGESPDDYEERDARQVTDLALAWLDRVDGPFFLFLNYFDPHWPYRPPEEFARQWVSADDESISSKQSARIWSEVLGGHRELRDSERRSMIDHYDGEIAAMDAEIGRLLDGLRARGSYAPTMIVAVSDHGESFGEHQLIDHGSSLFEQQLRAALIVKYAQPGAPRPAGRIIDQRVDLLDVYTEIAAEVGLSGGPPVGQRSVAPGRQLEARGLHAERRFHFASQYRQQWFVDAYGPRFDRDLEAIYRENWKLIRDDRGGVALFDLARDPEELHDLSSAEPEVVSELLAARSLWSDEERPVGTDEPVEISSELADRLRALGYLERSEPPE